MFPFYLGLTAEQLDDLTNAIASRLAWLRTNATDVEQEDEMRRQRELLRRVVALDPAAVSAIASTKAVDVDEVADAFVASGLGVRVDGPGY